MHVDRNTLARRLRDRLEPLAVEFGLPGFAVAVHRNGQEIFSGGFGLRDVDGVLPVTADTGFGVASVTKFLTAVLIMQARDRALLALSDPVSRFFPDLDSARDGKMQIHHLLSHSAGLPGLPFRHLATPTEVVDGPDRMRTASDLVTGMNAMHIERLGAPGERMSYSNEGFCLLGGVIEALHGCSYAEAADRFVFQPLEMTHSVIGGGDMTGQRSNLAMPVKRSGGRLTACGFWDAPLFYPVGGLIASVRDMARLISLLEGNTAVLGPESARDMASWTRPVASRPGSDGRYGLALEVSTLDDGRVLGWHTGQRPGISSFVGHVVQSNVSVSFATNMADVPSAWIGRQIVDDMLGTGGGSVADSPPHPEIRGPKRFCGRFGSREMGAVDVQQAGGRLLADLPSGRQALVFETPYSGTVGGLSFCFLCGDRPASMKESATALALDLRILPRLGAN